MSELTAAPVEERAYDTAPYAAHPHFHSQPLRTGATAKLFGLTPPAIHTARVLELGCAGGGNLIPLAEAYPHAVFVGVDISGKQIAAGQARIERLGLTNIRLKKLGIDELTPGDGEFDYILAHGVYSWVPKPVQEAILRVSKQNLAPAGIAYVSYNAYPGWRLKAMMRDIMRFHTEGYPDTPETVAEAVTVLGEIAAQSSGVYATVLSREFKALKALEASYIRHEQLEAVNDPCYFSDFIARAQNWGLSYLAETEPTRAIPECFDLEVARRVRKLAGDDVIALEQYFDFFMGRQFRMTLLVHEAQAGHIRRQLTPASIGDLSFVLRSTMQREYLAPEHPLSMTSAFASFRSELDTLTVNHPLQVRALEILERLGAAHPGTITVADLTERAAMPDPPAEEDYARVAELVFEIFRRQMLWFFSDPVAAAPVSAYPKVRRLTLDDAQHHPNSTTGLLHQKIRIDDQNIRILLGLLDGTRDTAALVKAIAACVEAGTVTLAAEKTPAAWVQEMLESYARLRLFVA